MARSAEAALFLLLGQSNAVGHGIPMEKEDQINVPSEHVFGLSREKNQSFFGHELFWEGYTSGGMNLAEAQDHTYSLANCLARLWQEEENLPDLYIVQIAVGAQGVTEGYMWNPDYEKKLIPGALGTVDIALSAFSEHIFSLLKRSMHDLGKTTLYPMLHWRGGEEDTTVSAERLRTVLKPIYTTMLQGFYEAFGEPIPTVLHRIVAHERCEMLDPSGGALRSMHEINRTFEALCEENICMKMFDIRNAPFFLPNEKGNGLFGEDMVHYTPRSNQWAAHQILRDYQRQIQKKSEL